jgi:hypothetical protein
MKITFAILFTSIFLNLGNKVDAQNISFKKIEYASFDVTPPKSKYKDHIRIGLYYSINKTGLVKILNDDDYHNTLTFDTYQLSIAQLKKINSIFNYTKHLKDYVMRKNLDNDEFFQGTYKFLSVIYRNDRKDSLCFIVPFMSNDFQNVYHMLDSIYWADKKRLKKIQPFPIPQYFKNSVLSNYKKSKLPKKKSLPSFRLEDQH